MIAFHFLSFILICNNFLILLDSFYNGASKLSKGRYDMLEPKLMFLRLLF